MHMHVDRQATSVDTWWPGPAGGYGTWAGPGDPTSNLGSLGWRG